ncbi:MAG: amidohydrolase, partial [Pseudomonadota bacterium]
MPVLNRIAAFADEMTDWRRHLHAHPELGLDCHETARFIETRLRSFGVDQIVTGIAESGLVALIEGQRPGPTIGLRADMDALPIAEATGVPYMSSRAHVMHACGHDGHSAMLLGAARYLAETRNFAGRAALIFQPAEEGPGGAEIMVEQGIFDRFGISRVFALHTKPGLETGHFATTPGPIMAATDTFEIHVEGRGGHAAMPHQSRDVVIATCAIVQAIQTIVSRNHDPVEDLALSVTQIHTG